MYGTNFGKFPGELLVLFEKEWNSKRILKFWINLINFLIKLKNEEF
jgi:hypothetical protein